MENSAAFKYLAVDTEGYAPNILGISVANPALQSMYFPLRHRERDVNIDEDTFTVLERVLENVPYRIFHHAGHDLIALPKLFNLPFVCTMIMAHMVNENLMSKSLDYVHKHYCQGEGKQMHPLMASIIKTSGWEGVPIELVNDYADNDAMITMESFQALLPLFEEQFGPLW